MCTDGIGLHRGLCCFGSLHSLAEALDDLLLELFSRLDHRLRLEDRVLELHLEGALDETDVVDVDVLRAVDVLAGVLVQLEHVALERVVEEGLLELTPEELRVNFDDLVLAVLVLLALVGVVGVSGRVLVDVVRRAEVLLEQVLRLDVVQEFGVVVDDNDLVGCPAREEGLDDREDGAEEPVRLPNEDRIQALRVVVLQNLDEARHDRVHVRVPVLVLFEPLPVPDHRYPLRPGLL